MKAYILNNLQDLPEVAELEEIREAGTYAVSGFDRPVNVAPVTEYGEEQIRNQYETAFFFTGADGSRFYGIRTGEFIR